MEGNKGEGMKHYTMKVKVPNNITGIIKALKKSYPHETVLLNKDYFCTKGSVIGVSYQLYISNIMHQIDMSFNQLRAEASEWIK